MPGLGTILRFGAPLFGGFVDTARSHHANQYNRRQQEQALAYLDAQGGGNVADMQRLLGWGMGQRAGATGQLLYGQPGQPGSVPFLGSDGAAAPTRVEGGRSGRGVVAGSGQPRIGGQMAPGTPQLAQALQGYAGRYDATIKSLQDRQNRNLAYLDTVSQQGKRDIDTAYDNEAGRLQQDAIGRGLSGTTLVPSMRAGNETRRAESQARFSDQLARERLAADAQLSGDTINAMQGLSGDFLGALDARNTGDLAYATGLAGNVFGQRDSDINRRLGVMLGYPAQGPPPGNIGNSLGMAMNNLTAYQAANRQPSSSSWIGPSVTSGLFNLGSAGIYGAALR